MPGILNPPWFCADVFVVLAFIVLATTMSPSSSPETISVKSSLDTTRPTRYARVAWHLLKIQASLALNPGFADILHTV